MDDRVLSARYKRLSPDKKTSMNSFFCFDTTPIPALTNNSNNHSPQDADVDVCMEAIHNARASRKQHMRHPSTPGYDFHNNGHDNNSIRVERNGFLHSNKKNGMGDGDSQPTMLASNNVYASFLKVELPGSSNSHNLPSFRKIHISKIRDPHTNNDHPSLLVLTKLVTKAVIQQNLLQNPANKQMPYVSLKYYDDDGDLIQLDTDEDLVEALKYTPQHGLKIKVFETVMPPPSPPRDSWLFPNSDRNTAKRGNGSSFLSDIYETLSMGAATGQAATTSKPQTARNNLVSTSESTMNRGATRNHDNTNRTVVMGQPCDPAGHSRTSVRRPYNTSIAPTPRNNSCIAPTPRKSAVSPTPRARHHMPQDLNAAEDHVQRHLMKLRESREPYNGSSAHASSTASTTASSAIARSRLQSGRSSYSTIELSLHRRPNAFVRIPRESIQENGESSYFKLVETATRLFSIPRDIDPFLFLRVDQGKMIEVAHDFDLSEHLATPDTSGTIYIQVVDSVLSIGKQDGNLFDVSLGSIMELDGTYSFQTLINHARMANPGKPIKNLAFLNSQGQRNIISGSFHLNHSFQRLGNERHITIHPIYQQNPIVMMASDAKTFGNCSYGEDPPRTRLMAPNAVVCWDLSTLAPGQYRVTIQYYRATSLGSVYVSAGIVNNSDAEAMGVASRFRQKLPQPTYLKPTGDKTFDLDSYGELSLGEFSISGEEGEAFALVAQESGQPIMSVRYIDLVYLGI